MYLCDYHMHSHNSFDSKATIRENCAEAVKKGIKEICITEHFSLQPYNKSFEFLNFENYLAEIENCRNEFGDKLIIKVGLEVCEPHLDLKLGEYISNKPIDFVLGSIHNLDNLGLITFMSSNDKETSYSTYFKNVKKVADSPYIDVVAHFDLMKRYAFNKHGKYDFALHRDEIIEALKYIISKGKGIEVNTSTLRSNVNETMPGIDILREYYNLGGEIITVGSDSHNGKDVGAGIEESIKVLKEIGFKNIYTYEKRKPIAKKI